MMGVAQPVAIFLLCSAVGLSPPGGATGQPPGPACRQWMEEAEAEREAGRLKESANLYRRALACAPAWKEGWWGLGSVLYEMDQYAEAAVAFRRLTRLAGNRGDGYAMLGLCEARLGQDAAALRHLAQGRKLGLRNDPAFARVVWFNEGWLFLRQGQFAAAQERFESLVRDGVPARQIAFPLGASVLGVVPGGNAAEAAALRPAVEAAGQAQYFAARKEIGPARQYWEAFLRNYGHLRNAHFAFGRFLLSIYDDDGAVKEFQAEVAQNPGHVLAHLGVAGTKAGQDPEFALPYAEKAVKLAPRLGEAHFLLGMILLNLGNTGRAIAELETARRLAPREAKVYFQLARAYMRAGRASDAASARKVFEQLGGAAGEPASGPVAPGKDKSPQ